MQPAQATVREQGVDWITATAPHDGRDIELLVKADDLLAWEEAQGNELKRMKWQGYDLKKCGQVAAGLREDGAMVRLSGVAARQHWKGLVPYAKSVTRLDLQVSVSPDPQDPRLGARHLAEYLRWRRERERAPKVRYTGSPDGIETVYLGSRSSERFCRIYDKHAESQDDEYEGVWRYEVETKGDVASSLSRSLYHSAAPDLACGVYVFDHLAANGIRPRFDRGKGIVCGLQSRRGTDTDRRLRWLGEQVAPTLVMLEQNGKGPEAVAALGLRELLGRLDDVAS